jgi:hypothetical protein
MGRRAWRQWRAVARFVFAQFCGNLAQEAGREDVDVEQLPRLNLDLVGRLVPGPVEDNLRGVEDGRGVQHRREHRRQLRRREEPREHIDRGVLERLEPLDRLLLHVRRRATMKPANSASWNRRILTPLTALP